MGQYRNCSQIKKQTRKQVITDQDWGTIPKKGTCQLFKWLVCFDWWGIAMYPRPYSICLHHTRNHFYVVSQSRQVASILVSNVYYSFIIYGIFSRLKNMILFFTYVQQKNYKWVIKKKHREEVGHLFACSEQHVQLCATE